MKQPWNGWLVKKLHTLRHYSPCQSGRLQVRPLPYYADEGPVVGEKRTPSVGERSQPVSADMRQFLRLLLSRQA